MNHRIALPTHAALFALALLAPACSSEAEPGIRKRAEVEARPKPVHDGQIVQLTGGGGHIEVVLNQSAGHITLYVFGPDKKPVAVSSPPFLNLTESALQLPGAPLAGQPTGTAWTFSSEALKVHVHGARFRLGVAGVTYTPDWHAPH